MTLAEAARMFGVTPRTLRRRLLALEARTGRVFLVRSGGIGRHVRYLVTLNLLRRHCPEMFDTHAEVKEAVNERFADIDDRLFEMRRRHNDLASRLRSFASDVTARLDAIGDQLRHVVTSKPA